MTIKPVTSVNFTGNYNQVNFNGRKKKPSGNRESSGMTVSNRLAVPLAAAITMAPIGVLDSKTGNKYNLDVNNKIEYVDKINSVNQNSEENGVVIESKNFNSKVYGNYKINLISTDGNDNTFEKVAMLQYNNLVGKVLSNDVKNLAVYNYQIISNDGSKGNQFSLKDVLVDSGMDAVPYAFNQPDFVNYIEGLIDDPRNNKAVNKVINNRIIRPDQDGYFQNVSKGDILKNAVSCKINAKLVGSEDVTIEGKPAGVLRFYSVSGNENKIDQITYQKNGYPELRIFMLYAHNHVFEPYSDAPTSIVTGIMNLVDGKNKSYYLEEPGLVFALADLKAKNPEKFKFSILGASKTINYLVTPKIGAIMPVVPEEE